MKLTFVLPGVGRKPGESYARSWTMEPLSLAVLASRTPPDIEISFIDDRLESINYDEPTDAVAMNIETYTARRAYAIAAQFRQRGVPVIMGGYHATLVPEEVQRYTDAVVVGQAESVWPTIINHLKSGWLQPVYHAPAQMDLSGIFPRRDIFHGKNYMPIALIEAGRGCRFECDFCSVTRFYRRCSAQRPISDVVREITRTGRHDVFFVDDNIVTNPEHAKSLFRAIRPLNIQWFSQGSITMADDPELLATMRQSGCCGVLIGFESLSPMSLAAMGKSWNKAIRDYTESIARIRDAGIPIYATFVFGYDTDDADIFQRTLDFSIEQRFFMAAFNHLVPFPGTPLYQRLKDAGRLICDPWWLSGNYRFGDVAFQPATMSPEQLAQKCYDARCIACVGGYLAVFLLKRAGAQVREKPGPGLFGHADDNTVGILSGFFGQKRYVNSTQDNRNIAAAKMAGKRVGAPRSAGKDADGNQIGRKIQWNRIHAFIDEAELHIRNRLPDGGKGGERERGLARGF